VETQKQALKSHSILKEAIEKQKKDRKLIMNVINSQKDKIASLQTEYEKEK